ncbi:MAG: hypothetical protein ACLFP9_05640 [Desulfonatronovibrio sp.]
MCCQLLSHILYMTLVILVVFFCFQASAQEQAESGMQVQEHLQHIGQNSS